MPKDKKNDKTYLGKIPDDENTLFRSLTRPNTNSFAPKSPKPNIDKIIDKDTKKK